MSQLPTQSIADHNKKLQRAGFFTFPIRPGSKLPAVTDFANKATRNQTETDRWWGINPSFNIGIYCGKFGDDGESLLVVDVDNKNGKKGSDELFRLECNGFELPETRTQITPTKGEHRIFRSKMPLGNSCEKLGPGIDTRGVGGYILGAGSRINGGIYTSSDHDIAECPEWITQRFCGSPKPQSPQTRTIDERVDSSSANARASHYLQHEAPVAREGEGGDHTTFQVAAHVKDLGVTQSDCALLMDTLWNPRCEPPWNSAELEQKINNAYRYGKNAPGIAAPEVEFANTMKPQTENPAQDVHPFLELNKQYAFVLSGGAGHILWETKDSEDNFNLQHLAIPAFHQHLANKMLSTGNGRTHPVSELWMKAKVRRQYNGICFMPEQKAPDAFYNLWRGFAVKPLAVGEKPNDIMADSLNKFLEHAFENVCDKDTKTFEWLMTYFAHLVQKPWKKPLTALVFQGAKGVGKNALIDRIGYLLGDHYLVAANRRFLTGNFNSHLENKLLFTLDEAFWSGDTAAEGILKDLITGQKHLVERKGHEPYPIKNCVRICIIGNEQWLVPASVDERRFAVFAVGEGRKQDNDYFDSMREGMVSGGYKLLLRYLLDYDISKADPNKAPQNSALLDQKHKSLDPFHQWWLECISTGRIAGASFSHGWPEKVNRDDLRNTLDRYVKSRQIKKWMPDSITIGKALKKVAPNIGSKQIREGAERVWVYVLPPLEECRSDWEKHVGHKCVWEAQETDS